MKHYKKIILTLVALLALTTQAWADGDLTNKVWKPNDKINIGQAWFCHDDAHKENLYHANGTDGTLPAFTYDDNVHQWKSEGCIPCDKKDFGIEENFDNNAIIYFTPPTGKTSADTPIGIKIKSGSGTKESPYLFELVYEGTPVTVTKTEGKTNEWTLTMPAGNVEVAPEYYTQATVTTGGVTAATGVQATTDAELVKIDNTKIEGASGMKYIVTTDATPTPAYDATGWSDKVPTAANITTVGLTYVWYYPVGKDDGDNSYSDGNICTTPIEVSIAPAPTYAVTFADGIDEADKWTASPATGVKKGETVNVTYTGTKKVLGVTVTKRVSLVYPITISEVTDEAYIGSVVADDGYVYATLDDVDNASKTAVAKICYVGSETGDATYNHGLALALRDVSEIKSWCSHSNNCLVSQYTTVVEAKGDLAGIANTDVLVGTTPHSHGDNAAKAARGYNSGTHLEGTSAWFLPSVGQWDKMVTAVGDYGKLGLYSGNYWSSTEVDAENAWSVNGGSWSTGRKYYNQGIRACLAF